MPNPAPEGATIANQAHGPTANPAADEDRYRAEMLNAVNAIRGWVTFLDAMTLAGLIVGGIVFVATVEASYP